MRQTISKPKGGRKTTAFKQLWSLHWIMAACFLVVYIIGAFMVRLPEEVSFRSSFYDFHKSIGVLVMGLLLARIFVLLHVYWSKYSRRHPKFTKEWFREVTLYTALYLFMLVVPISGFFLSNSGDYDVAFFGIVLPRTFRVNLAVTEFAKSLHFWLAYTFLAFIALHTFEQHSFIQLTWRRISNATTSK